MLGIRYWNVFINNQGKDYIRQSQINSRSDAIWEVLNDLDNYSHTIIVHNGEPTIDHLDSEAEMLQLEENRYVQDY